MIYLLWKDGKRVNIGEFCDEVKAHINLESFAKKLNLRIYDQTGAETVITEPNELDLPLREKIKKERQVKDSKKIAKPAVRREEFSPSRKDDILLKPPWVTTSYTFERGVHHFVLPREGFSFGLVPIIIFICFWYGLLHFFGGKGAPIFFQLFLIPFYAAGIALIIRVLYSILSQTHLLVSPHSVTMYNVFLWWKWRPNTVSTDKIEEVKFERVSGKSNFRIGSSAEQLEIAIRTDEKYLKFGKHLGEAEKEWLAASIKSIISA
jgi:hypothetical protein